MDYKEKRREEELAKLREEKAKVKKEFVDTGAYSSMLTRIRDKRRNKPTPEDLPF